MKKFSFLLLVVFVSASISQEVIRFQIPTDNGGSPAPVVAAPKPAATQKIESSGSAPLDLNALSAKDTDNFEIYSQRLALINDSIAVNNSTTETVKSNTKSTMPPLEPKGEFEKQAEYDMRAQKWRSELAIRMERDTKSLSDRLEQLEKAKSRIINNQTSLYGSIDIKTNPSAVSIFIDGEEVGTSPAEYKMLIPGTRNIRLKKDGLHQYDTTFNATAGAKFKLNVELEEKSIFSQENEISFLKLLNKDTTVQGYEARIGIVDARIVQIDEEIKDILNNFSNEYPKLDPQQPDESSDAFKKRHDAWSKEGMRQYKELQEKHEAYKNKLERSKVVLKDYIVAAYSEVLSEPAPGTTIELGAYDAEKEAFQVAAKNTESEKSPFLFSGSVIVPRDVAINLNRSEPGFAAVVQFINYPFETESGSVNLAMSKLLLSNLGKELKVEGSFGEIEKYKSMKGYGVWKVHADSLLQGTLKSQGLEHNYVMGKAAAKSATKDEGSGVEWSTWVMIAAFAGAATFTGLAVYKHFEADNALNNINKLKNNPPTAASGSTNTAAWTAYYNKYKKSVEDNESQRNIFGVLAGVFAAAGVATFFF